MGASSSSKWYEQGRDTWKGAPLRNLEGQAETGLNAELRNWWQEDIQRLSWESDWVSRLPELAGFIEAGLLRRGYLQWTFHDIACSYPQHELPNIWKLYLHDSIQLGRYTNVRNPCFSQMQVGDAVLRTLCCQLNKDAIHLWERRGIVAPDMFRIPEKSPWQSAIVLEIQLNDALAEAYDAMEFQRIAPNADPSRANDYGKSKLHGKADIVEATLAELVERVEDDDGGSGDFSAMVACLIGHILFWLRMEAMRQSIRRVPAAGLWI